MTNLRSPLASYITVTLSYWAFTLTDGALRMLVVLFFHQLGYSPLHIAGLFLFYELFGMLTNLLGGWLAARTGLNVTLQLGLGLQIVALSMLLIDQSLLTVAWVMIAQALSGIAKDLSKMSAKSSIKTLLPGQTSNRLYHWVAVLTGSKNAIKGIGFFLGGALLAAVGFRTTVTMMGAMLAVVLLCSLLLLNNSLGRSSYKPKFSELFSSSGAVNLLSAARLFLFGSRDIWFVVALPVYLQEHFNWSHSAVGTLLALWIIGYGIIQARAPAITGINRGIIPTGHTARQWAVALCLLPSLIGFALWLQWYPLYSLIAGLLLFGAVFAINSSVHSYLIVAYAREDGVSLDVGFYYMSNAAGRLLGTLLSGGIYQLWGLLPCLLLSSAMIAASAILAARLPHTHQPC